MFRAGGLLVLALFLPQSNAGPTDGKPAILNLTDWADIKKPTFDNGGPPPIQVDMEHAQEHGIIVVLIASFREMRCPQTLAHLFAKAKFPNRIRIGVVQQNAEDDVDCLVGYCEVIGTTGGSDKCQYSDQVRMIRMKDTDAKGPVFARALQVELVEKHDDFCMQIDAHTDAVKEWDVKLLNEWKATENEFAVLSTYPTSVDNLEINTGDHWEMPHLCKASFMPNGIVKNGQASSACNLEWPPLSPLWAAGFSFSRCHAERTVPNDPELKSVFWGEEYARGSRLWTHGYDFYTLTRPIIGTYYGGDKHGKGSFKSNRTETKFSDDRMATLLRWPDSDQSIEATTRLGRYGMGHHRSLEQYALFSGCDTINLKLNPSCVVDYVPWDWADAVKHLSANGNEIHNSKKLERFRKSQAQLAKLSLAEQHMLNVKLKRHQQAQLNQQEIVAASSQQQQQQHHHHHHQQHRPSMSTPIIVFVLGVALVAVVLGGLWQLSKSGTFYRKPSRLIM